MYSKLDLFNDIHELVEKYIASELAKFIPEGEDADSEVEIQVELDESDGQGHYVDMLTGNIWDLESQEIIGQKDLVSGVKTMIEADQSH